MIELSDISKRFGAVEAVRNLSLHVPRGELFCFLGPNGAGKTTTIKMMTGLLQPDNGTIRIAGIDVVQEPVRAKQLMGYIPDMPFVYEKLTVTEFFRFTADLYGVPAREAAARQEKYFAQFGLEEYQKVLTGELSHGMRQRMLYAVTLLHDPEVLFIDEPLIGLDPYTIRMIKNLLKSRARDGMTIFLTTHILALAEDIADRIGIISQGELVAVGSLADLARHSPGKQRLEDVFLQITGARDLEEVV